MIQKIIYQNLIIVRNLNLIKIYSIIKDVYLFLKDEAKLYIFKANNNF